MPQKRNQIHVNATIDPWMYEWVKGMEGSTNLSFSRLLREIIGYAHKTGYTPGRVSLGDMRRETRLRAGLRDKPP